jgi:sugar O-acyltransferase (sialic acid O-acetyltransferase NeuD family)
MRCIIYGISTSYFYDVLDSIERLGWEIAGYVVNMPEQSIPQGLSSPVCRPQEIPDEWLLNSIVFPQITPAFRMSLKLETMELGFKSFANVVDPTAIVSPRAKLGQGVMVNAGSIIAANTEIGDFCLLNRGVSIGHDVTLEKYVSFGPGAIACGSVVIGSGTFVGAGAIVNPKVNVGRNALIASGTVVKEDVPDRCLVVGNPGRVVKTAIDGYNHALVDPGATHY